MSEQGDPQAEEGHRASAPSRVALLALYSLQRWIVQEWNRKLLELGTTRGKSYDDLICKDEDLIELYREVLKSEHLIQKAHTTEEIRNILRRTFLEFTLSRDIEDWGDRLEELLTSGHSGRSGTLPGLSGIEFFYFWLCEAREAISNRPSLPLELGEAFGQSPSSVHSYLQNAHRKIGGGTQSQ